MINSDTQTISIETTPQKVFDFVADPQNLPRWAIGFAKAVREEQGRWFVKTDAGEIGLRIDADNNTGVVDFWMIPAPEVEVLAASRVVQRGGASEYIFTQFQSGGMSNEDFNRSVQALRHELSVLKAQLEIECPL
ncbi:MAG: hypothetical protein WC782_09600 [Methylococcaceae bacterium]|jgi:hypothetical protein